MISPEPDAGLEELARLAAEGDHSAWCKIIDRFDPRLPRFLSAVLFVPASQLDDLTQEVWVRVAKNLARRQPGSFTGWLFQIARNLVIDRRRARRTAAGSIDDHDPGDAGPGPEEVAESEDECRKLRRCIGRLDAAQGAVVKMHLGGFSEEQIAAKVGVPAGTVKSRFSRAKDALRVCMESSP